MFGSDCAGAAPLAKLPTSLVLSRATPDDIVERSATLLTAVSRPT